MRHCFRTNRAPRDATLGVAASSPLDASDGRGGPIAFVALH